MGAIDGEEMASEKILVTVRLRPLNDKEIAKNDVPDWECINDNTLIYRNTLAQRYNYPTAYTFDRVFQGYCTTKQVYDEAAKGVALSVVTGINSSVFAYGQTSSGKTYTMTGITEYTVADIFDYIQKHEERAFVLKFSAMEIYNEAVRDLLSGDTSPLRILDDPEKGTIVEKLTEETLRDWNHLRQLLSVCEAQRQVGETLLNEASSRSHQILRLTIESSAREFLGKGNSSTLAATVNFVDLAGSERASQALSAGARLKEGCHINRSLLTLGSVIRKLSKGRNGHVPYRDSKLTRILQPSLGGNARTAIICTVCPARSHVEQTRNTLLFASCAKEVATNAHVNVVMSDKALVKQLQKELARLESELRTPIPTPVVSNSAALLREKDRQIQKMEKQIKELTTQRDLAQSRLEDLLKVVADDKTSKQGAAGRCSKDVGLDPMNDPLGTPLSWPLEFQRQRREIIRLWHSCNVSLVHRTYFFLLFNGDPTDNIYMEVELRRLSFLKQSLSQGSSRQLGEDARSVTPASSMRALRREREMLCRRMQKRFSVKERESLYEKWGIGLDTKQRRLQLVRRLWSDNEDVEHITESAAIVAKLVGLLQPGQALKEMFGLSFTPATTSSSQRSSSFSSSYSWRRHSLSSLR
ncbi:hypothetical protein ACHQM5_024733 [Ranunculus cassubicifolius]